MPRFLKKIRHSENARIGLVAIRAHWPDRLSFFVPARTAGRAAAGMTPTKLCGAVTCCTGKSQRTLYFAGDTGYGPHFKQIRARFPVIDIALLPIGAYEPRWFMKEAHMNPAEAVQAVRLDLAAQQSFGNAFCRALSSSSDELHRPTGAGFSGRPPKKPVGVLSVDALSNP